MNDNMNFIVGIGYDEHNYSINGVQYSVTPHYAPVDFQRKDNQTLSGCLRHFIASDFADLSSLSEEGMLEGEDACSAAGKED